MKLRNMASVYITHGDEILLLYRRGSRVANNSYVASAGGHFEEGELNAPRACVEREMHEELGLRPEDLGEMRLRYITLRRKNGEIRQIYYYFAELDDKEKVTVSNEGGLEWVRLDRALELTMPFTAWWVVKHYIEKGRETDALYAGTTLPEGVVFHELREFEG